MLNIFEFVRRYYFLLLFLLLEFIALTLTAGRQVRPQAFFVNSSNFFTSVVYNNSFKISEYFSLRRENNILLEENRALRNSNQNEIIFKNYFFIDSIRGYQFEFFSGKVVKNSVLSKNNFITINKGSADGIKKDMGVVNSNGVIGIVTNVSRNYCVALSVLNSLNSVGCKLKKSDYYGAASWDEKNYRQIILEGIPNHVLINRGDTVVTSGYGSVFPPNVTVGVIDTFWKNTDNNFFTVRINLSVDLKKITNVYLIKNKLLDEQKDLELETDDFM